MTVAIRAWGLGLALAFVGRGLAAAPPPPPSVLLITVDTLRPDALGWVAGRNLTPAIDALAAQGARFPAAVSPAPLTLPAHASLLTGLIPPRHGVRDNGQVLGPGPRTLAEALRARGYATAAVVSGYPLRAMFGLDRGFERYDDTLPVAGGDWSERPAPETAQAALSWLRSRAANSGPFFLWVHFYDPHDPYTPPEALRRPGPRGAYDGEVALVDQAIGSLRRGLADLGLASNLLTVFTADHGESLGEHGEDTHGFFVYDSTVLVPLVFHFPGQLSPRTSLAPARLVDVMPSLLDLLGEKPAGGLDGVSLRPLFEGKALTLPPAYSETLVPWLGYGWAPLAALHAEGWKLIQAPRPELYQTSRDPLEADNRFAAEPRRAAALEGLLAPLLRQAAASQQTQDAEAAERLRALGYAGGGSGSSRGWPTGLADPKDRLGVKDRLTSAERALGRGEQRAALMAFGQVLAEEPTNRYALLRSAAALARLGRYREAATRLARLLEADPAHAEARYALADALTRSGALSSAEAEWRAVTRLQPRRAVAWSNLGAVLAGQRRWTEAVEALVRASALEPGNAILAENLADARYEQALSEAAAGHLEGARRVLGEAVAGKAALKERAARDPRLRALLE